MMHLFCSLGVTEVIVLTIVSPPSLFPSPSSRVVPGNMNTNASITNLMLQTGMSRNQISQLAAKGISSSASLANMLGKQRSFDQLMSLDFQSMQSIDNLANLIQAGMPNHQRIPNAQRKNMDWGTQGLGVQGMGNAGAPSNLFSVGSSGGLKGSIENLVRTMSANSGNAATGAPVGLNNNMSNQANAIFGNFLQSASQQGGMNNLASAVGQAGGSQNNDLSNFIQTLQQQQQSNQQQQQQQNNMNLLQSMAMGGLGHGLGGSGLLQNNNAGINSGLNQNAGGGGGNDLMSMLNQVNQSAGSMGSMQQQGQNNMNPLLQQLANSQFNLGSLQNSNAQANQGNQLMAQLAQQQLLAQSGKPVVLSLTSVH